MQVLTEPLPADSKCRVAELAAEILRRHRNAIRELQVEVYEGGLILSGTAYSYYGKQIAQHETVRRTNLVLLANRLVVEYRAG